MWWHEQSWSRIEQLPRSLPVVVPLGSLEQHGRHLPLWVDSAQVTAIAERAQSLLKDEALFLPTLWLGCSDHHRDFAGTVSVPPTLYTQTIKSVAQSVLRAGFTRIFFLNGHGGNETPAAQALTELACEDDAADGAHLVFSSWWQLARDAIAPQRHGMATPAISHACEYETSLMLAIRPDLVDDAAAKAAPAPQPMPWNQGRFAGKVKAFHRFHRLTGTGSLGDPPAATAAKGDALLAAIVEDVVAFVREFATWPELPVRTRGSNRRE
jgi:creatinine amidohydrolase